MPAVMKTMSESRSVSAIFSESSSAARWPTLGSPPAPRPRVILSPMRILLGASDWSSACASELTEMNSTPMSSARIIRLTALLPPPPTPMTRMSAKFSESERSGMWCPSRSFPGAITPGPSTVTRGEGPPGRRAAEYIPVPSLATSRACLSSVSDGFSVIPVTARLEAVDVRPRPACERSGGCFPIGWDPGSLGSLRSTRTASGRGGRHRRSLVR